MNLADPLVIAGIVALLLVVLVLVWIFVSRARRKRRKEMLLREIPVHLVGLPREKDKEADSAIKTIRDRIVFDWRERAPFNPRDFYKISLDVTNQIAGIYHPDTKDPIKKASVAALMDLNRRVARRVSGLLDIPPFNLLGKIDLGVVMSVKKGAEGILDNPIVKYVTDNPLIRTIGKKFPQLFRAAKVASKGITPGRLAFEFGKDLTIEGAKRLFVSTVIGIVAEEAIAVYSGRFVRNEKAKADLLIIYTIAQALRDQGSISAAEHDVLLKHVVERNELDPDLRLFMIDYARGDARVEHQLVDELIHQSRRAAAGTERDPSEERVEWEGFCRLKEFSIVNRFGLSKRYIEAMEEFAEADGADPAFKREILRQVRSDLSQ